MKKEIKGVHNLKSESSKWDIEVINNNSSDRIFRSVLFDFDGTISLIRQGWQEIMKPYFFEILRQSSIDETDDEIMNCVGDFVDRLTGEQTIYQCIELAAEVSKRNSMPEKPEFYKDEYNRRLLKHIDIRIKNLENKKRELIDFVVPGSFELLCALKDLGNSLYLASGTDEPNVLYEASLLGVDKFFDGIYGAQKEYKLFSKKHVIENILIKHKLQGDQLLGFGDGYVEIENIKQVGGYAVGVASDELNKSGVDSWKRRRLIEAGADIIIADFSETDRLINFLLRGD